MGAKLFIFAGMVGTDSSFSSLKIRINEPFCFRHRRHMYLKFNDISTYKYNYKTLLLNKFAIELGYYFHHFQFRDFTAFWRMVPVQSMSYCCCFIHDYNHKYWSLCTFGLRVLWCLKCALYVRVKEKSCFLQVTFRKLNPTWLQIRYILKICDDTIL